MQFLSRLWIYTIIAVCQVPVSASTQLTLYPPGHALATVQSSWKKVANTESAYEIANLPNGIIPDFFSIVGIKQPIAIIGTASPTVRIISKTQPSTARWTSVLESITSSLSYQLVLGQPQSTINAILTVGNASSFTYADAKIAISIGDGLFTDLSSPRAIALKSMRDGAEVSGDQVKYFYTPPTPTTIGGNQVTQIPLFSGDRLRVERRYRFDGARWGNPSPETLLSTQLIFQNSTGYPLARGQVQVFNDGQLIAIGSLDSTYINGECRVDIGRAIDITGKRRSNQITTEKGIEETIEITLTNASNKVAVIDAFESFWAPTELVRASQGYTPANNQIRFECKLGPKEIRTIWVTLRQPK